MVGNVTWKSCFLIFMKYIHTSLCPRAYIDLKKIKQSCNSLMNSQLSGVQWYVFGDLCQLLVATSYNSTSACALWRTVGPWITAILYCHWNMWSEEIQKNIKEQCQVQIRE